MMAAIFIQPTFAQNDEKIIFRQTHTNPLCQLQGRGRTLQRE